MYIYLLWRIKYLAKWLWTINYPVSTTFYSDYSIVLYGIMSVRCSFKSEVDLIFRISHTYNINYALLLSELLLETSVSSTYTSLVFKPWAWITTYPATTAALILWIGPACPARWGTTFVLCEDFCIVELQCSDFVLTAESIHAVGECNSGHCDKGCRENYLFHRHKSVCYFVDNSMQEKG